MRTLSLSHCTFSIGAAAALLVGCGGLQPPIAASNLLAGSSRGREIVPPRPIAPAYKVSGPLLYTASYDLGLTPVRIYKANAKDPKPVAAIHKNIDSAGGACIDGDGTLYVANQTDGPGWVSEYALGRTKPLRVITKGINAPAYCAIDASGNLWVTNIGLDDVAEYLKGSTKPHTTITAGLTYPDGIAIDHAGNLYVGNLERSGTSNIQVYTPGSKSPSRTITDGVTWPVGIAVDAHDTLYVANATPAGNVEEYRVGQDEPYRTITEEMVVPRDVVISRSGWLYVAVGGYNTSPYAILEFPPRSLKPSSREITQGVFETQGLAYYPPILP
jgi:hypothetical protein